MLPIIHENLHPSPNYYFILASSSTKRLIALKCTGWSKISIWLMGTRFSAINYINEPGTQEPYWDIFIEPPCRGDLASEPVPTM
jgi:hypothetical protein